MSELNVSDIDLIKFSGFRIFRNEDFVQLGQNPSFTFSESEILEAQNSILSLNLDSCYAGVQDSWSKVEIPSTFEISIFNDRKFVLWCDCLFLLFLDGVFFILKIV